MIVNLPSKQASIDVAKGHPARCQAFARSCSERNRLMAAYYEELVDDSDRLGDFAEERWP